MFSIMNTCVVALYIWAVALTTMADDQPQARHQPMSNLRAQAFILAPRYLSDVPNSEQTSVVSTDRTGTTYGFGKAIKAAVIASRPTAETNADSNATTTGTASVAATP